MKYDVIVTGVGGQGVRTAASILRAAAHRSGLHALQFETYGHPQRGGAVASQLRLADRPLKILPIALGELDLILSLEPLESLRHLHLLSASGAVITATDPVPNIPAYPPIDELLLSILKLPSGYLVDATRLARSAGGAMAANSAIVGAAVGFLPLEPADVRAAIGEAFRGKGQAAVLVNLLAFEAGMSSLRHRELVDEFDTFSLAGH